MNQNSGIPSVGGTSLSATTTLPSGSTGALPSSAPGLRYKDEIAKLVGCPPSGVSRVDVMGYRFAFSDLNHAHNYLPIALIKPERIHAGQPITQCCTGYSLSVFNTPDALAAKARQVLKFAPNFLRKVGDHFVAIKISSTDGLCTAPNSVGHFDFFENSSFSGANAVVSHARLVL